MVVRNDARKVFEERMEQSRQQAHQKEIDSRPQRKRDREVRRVRDEEIEQILGYARKHHCLPDGTIGPDALVQALLRSGDTPVEKDAIKRLFEAGHVEHLQQIADSGSRWAELAKLAIIKIQNRSS